MKPQDVFVALKLLCYGSRPWNYEGMAKSLKISASTLHEAVQNLSFSRLYEEDSKRLNIHALEEFLFHGVQYAFPVKPGPMARGLATAHSAPAFKKTISGDDDDRYVWPYDEGKTRGFSIEPGG